MTDTQTETPDPASIETPPGVPEPDNIPGNILLDPDSEDATNTCGCCGDPYEPYEVYIRDNFSDTVAYQSLKRHYDGLCKVCRAILTRSSNAFLLESERERLVDEGIIPSGDDTNTDTEGESA